MAAERPVARADVLFLCTGNSARSQMAEALIEAVRRRRAGTQRGQPAEAAASRAVRVMRARGLDIAGRRSKHLDEFADARFDYVITLCDKVREVCPEFPGETMHWSLRDPAAAPEGAFERTAAELETRIGYLLRAL